MDGWIDRWKTANSLRFIDLFIDLSIRFIDLSIRFIDRFIQ